MQESSSRRLHLPMIPTSAAAFVILLLLTAAAGVLVVRAFASIEATTQRIYDTHMEVVFDALKKIRALERLQRSGHAVLLLSDPARRAELRKELGAVQGDAILQGDAEMRGTVEKAFTQLDRCIADAGHRAVAPPCLEQWRDIELEISDRMEAVTAQASFSAAEDLDKIVDTTTEARTWVLISVSTGIVSLLIAKLAFLLHVAAPVRRIAGKLGRARQGDAVLAGNSLLTELQMLDDAALALAEAHRNLSDARAELEVQANTDMLTGLANRRRFAATSESEFARLRRHRRPLAVILLDVDFFKKINDQFGHEGGDAVLRALGACLRAAVRPSDTAARFGGEEFALLLPETTLAGAAGLAERLRLALAALRVDMPDGSQHAFTASFGVAEVGAVDADVQPALQRADSALYRAKAAGRNRVEMATDTEA